MSVGVDDWEYWLTRKCRRCGIYYDPKKNIGRWECRVHTADLRPATVTYQCCGISMQWAGILAPNTERLGCTPIDHDVLLGGDDATEVAVRSYSPAAAFIQAGAAGQTLTTPDDYVVYLRRAIPGQTDAFYRRQLEFIQVDALNEPRFYLSADRAVVEEAWRALWQAKQRWDIEGQLRQVYPPNPLDAMGPNPGTATELVALLMAVRGMEEFEMRRRYMMSAVVDAVRAFRPHLMPTTTMVKRMADHPSLATLETSRLFTRSLYTTA